MWLFYGRNNSQLSAVRKDDLKFHLGEIIGCNGIHDNNQGLISKCQSCLICYSGEDDFVINNGRNWSLSSESCSYQADSSLSSYSGFSPKINPGAKMETIPLTISELQQCLWGWGQHPALPGSLSTPRERGSRGSPSQGNQDLPSRANPTAPST